MSPYLSADVFAFDPITDRLLEAASRIDGLEATEVTDDFLRNVGASLTSYAMRMGAARWDWRMTALRDAAAVYAHHHPEADELIWPSQCPY